MALDTNYRRGKNLDPRHYLILGDLSTVDAIQMEYFKKKKGFFWFLKVCLIYMEQGLIKWLERYETYHPLSTVVTVIQIIDSFNIIMIFFVYSWYIFFDYNDQTFLLSFFLISMVIFLIATFFKLNTGYLEGAELIVDKTMIFNLYKERYLMSDILAQFSLQFNIFNSDSTLATRFLSFPIFAKTKSLLENISILEEKMQIEGNNIYVWQLL